MKKCRLVYFVLCLMAVSLLASPVYAQNRTDDLAGIYKSYFKLLIDKDHTKAWEGLADESKRVIADLIAKEAEAPSDKVLGMLNTNENGLRDKYFIAFQESVSDLLNEIYSQGKFTVKKSDNKDAVIIIEVQQDPKDFGMVKQDGTWKVNFFKDIMLMEGK